MQLRPAVGALCGAESFGGKAGIIFGIGLEQHRCLCHHGGKVQRGSHAFLHHVARLLAVGGLHGTFGRRCGQLVIDSAVGRVLHGQQPAKAVVNLVQKVGRGVAAFGDAHALLAEVVGEQPISRLHQANAEGGINHVFAIVASIVPTLRGRQHVARLALRPGGAGMHLHLGIGMCGRAAPLSGIRLFNRHTGPLVIERLEGSIGHGSQRTFLDFECGRVSTRQQQVVAGLVQRTEIHRRARPGSPRIGHRRCGSAFQYFFARSRVQHGEVCHSHCVRHGDFLLSGEIAQLVQSDYIGGGAAARSQPACQNCQTNQFLLHKML